MELNEQKINVHERRAKSLLQKLHGYFDDANLVSEGGEDQLVPMFKFRRVYFLNISVSEH